MKLATIRYKDGATRAVRVDDDRVVETGDPDVGALLRRGDWRERAASASGRSHDPAALQFAPVVTAPGKIVCVGLNYRQHVLEMGRDIPEHPTLFAKFAPALIGATDVIELPPVSERMDWEAELAVVVGAPVRSVSEHEARSVIAGYTACNDVTARDWQRRSPQWLQGKTFQATCPLGPVLVTADDPELPRSGMTVECRVNGELVQQACTDDLIFGPSQLIAYISTIVRLDAGDVIATGTPGGVGDARTPPRYLADGDLLETHVTGIGTCSNRCRLDGEDPRR